MADYTQFEEDLSKRYPQKPSPIVGDPNLPKGPDITSMYKGVGKTATLAPDTGTIMYPQQQPKLQPYQATLAKMQGAPQQPVAPVTGMDYGQAGGQPEVGDATRRARIAYGTENPAGKGYLETKAILEGKRSQTRNTKEIRAINSQLKQLVDPSKPVPISEQEEKTRGAIRIEEAKAANTLDHDVTMLALTDQTGRSMEELRSSLIEQRTNNTWKREVELARQKGEIVDDPKWVSKRAAEKADEIAVVASRLEAENKYKEAQDKRTEESAMRMIQQQAETDAAIRGGTTETTSIKDVPIYGDDGETITGYHKLGSTKKTTVDASGIPKAPAAIETKTPDGEPRKFTSLSAEEKAALDTEYSDGKKFMDDPSLTPLDKFRLNKRLKEIEAMQ